jgi:hypothetical protein
MAGEPERGGGLVSSRTALRAARCDLPTLIAVAVVAYALTNVLHEGGGHGGACVIVGGKPKELNAVFFDCGDEHLSVAAVRWVAAGGTIVNLVTGALAWAGLRASGKGITVGRYFLWLLMTLSLLQATGYWLFSGLADIGDWAAVTAGLTPGWPWRVLLTAAGGGGYYLTARLALAELVPFLGPESGRVAHARTLMLVPYLTGGVLYVAAGLLNPVSPALVLISAAAASLGGTSGLAWMYNLLRAPARTQVETPPLAVPRSLAWIGLAAAVAGVFIGVLGRSVRF